jgi:hypothetical protein
MRAKERTDMDSVMVTLKVEVMALKFVMLSLIDALPETQKAAVCGIITSFATATDAHKSDFPVFSIGEDATDQMNDSLSQIVGLVAEFPAMRQHLKPKETPAHSLL